MLEGGERRREDIEWRDAIGYIYMSNCICIYNWTYVIDIHIYLYIWRARLRKDERGEWERPESGERWLHLYIYHIVGFV